jgi:hypothetical protein
VPVFPSEVISDLTKSKSLINGTLTQEQIAEVEKSPNGFILTCHSRVIEGSDPGKVCDSAFNYLYDKCQRLDNVPDYCLSLSKGGITGYMIDRLDQLLNLGDKPELSEIYKTWKITRDNPECELNSGLLICP